MRICLKCGETKCESAFYVHRRTCKSCVLVAQRDRNIANPERRVDIRKKNYYKDIEKTRLERRVHAKNKRARDGDAARARERAYYRANPESSRRRSLEYVKRNPHLNAMRVVKYRCATKQATPAWANNFFVEEIYDLAQRRTRATGVLWTVDHLVPLQSKNVCGLHCEANLAVITKIANCQKKNSHWPDMW